MAKVSAIFHFDTRPLQWEGWSDIPRIQEAATMPYRSLQRNRDSYTDGVRLLQIALKLVGKLSFIGPDGKPHPFGPYNIAPGEFPDENDSSGCWFGLTTETAVKRFQRSMQSTSDGKAGSDTLHGMDFIIKLHY